MKTKDTKELIYIGMAAMVVGVTLTLLELYYNNYQLLSAVSLNIPVLDGYFAAHPAWGFLETNIYLRLYLILTWSLLLFYPNSGEKKAGAWKHVLWLLALCGVFYALRFTYFMLPAGAAQVANLAGTMLLIIPILRKFIFLSRYLSLTSADLSANEKNADGFEQNQELMTNEYSVNLKHEYSHGGKLHTGYVNFINPFRGTITLGTPGSGKTYVSLEEFMRQFISRGYAAVIYDYKDPALSQLAYSYLRDYQLANGKKTPAWGYISFKDLNRTYRSNPMKGITTSEEANDFADVVLLALNRNLAEKQGEFFGESAKNYTAVCIFILGTLFDGKYLSLPHVLSLVGASLGNLLPIFAMMSVFYPNLKTITNTFLEAYEQGAVEQLQGQVASARIGLARMNNPLLCYVMTESKEHPEENISLDINDEKNPVVFCIGNDPQKDIILGLASSVYLSKLAKSSNKKGCPMLFGVDELPTVFVKGLDNLIATARSNKIAVSLGFQDYTQLVRDYTQKVADAIINTCGNLICGSVKGETARKLSESFGEKKVLKQSKTVNHEGDISVSYSEQRERKLPQDVIEELSQGTFVGRMMDEFHQKIKHKVFHGRFTIDPEWKKIRHAIPKLRDLTLQEQTVTVMRAQKDVMEEVQLFLNEAGEVAKLYDQLVKTMTMQRPQKKDEEPPPICLERFVENPDEPEEQRQFALWLEMAYTIINNFDALQPVNNIFNDEEKFEMLLSNTYKAESEKIHLVKNYRKNLNLKTLKEVKAFVEQQEQVEHKQQEQQEQVEHEQQEQQEQVEHDS
jgi:hypothetical protein